MSAEGWRDQDIGDYTIYVNEGSNRPDFTLDQAAFFLTDQFSSPSKWASTSLTYDVSALPAAVQALAIAAMNLWADASGLTFTAVSGGGSADLTFQDNEDGAFASSTRSGSNITAATINVSQTDWIDTYGTEFNSYAFQTYIHEVGHALGLGHSGPYNGGADYASDRLYNQDAWNYSVMSYFDQTEAGNGTARLVLGLQMVDILAIQDLYGTASGGTRGGDTVYGFNSNAGDSFDFQAWQTAGIRPPSLAIYDTGGVDTLDMSGYSAHQTISLVEETFSSVGDNTNTGDTTDALVNLISVARGSVIENAVGGSGNDTMTGNAADNQLEGGAGNDAIDGGDGTDYAVFATGVLADYTVMDDGMGTVTVTHSTYGTDTLTNVEFLRINGVDHALNASNGPINGTEASETLTGTADADTINGLGGNDVLAGLGGADTLGGGAGTDTADYSASAAGVTVKLWNGTGVGGDAEGDTLAAIENLTGSAAADTLMGSSAVNNALDGGAGNDALYGLSGDDVLTGGTGNDTIDGGTGTDYAAYASGVLADYTLTYNANGTITVEHATFGTDTLSGVEFLRIDGVDHSLAQGGSQDGTPGADTLTGTDFADQLNGLGGNDILIGLGDADALDGGEGSDTADYSASNAGVLVKLWNGTGAGGDAEGDTLTSIENVIGSASGDTLVGSSTANNDLDGGGGNDFMYGLAGDDVLTGGTGDDTLDGGTGTDYAEYASGVLADYTITYNGNGTITVAHSTFGTDTLTDVEFLRINGVDHSLAQGGTQNGTPDADTLTGSSFVDQLNGLGGDDTLIGLGDADVLDGGEGSDTADYSASSAGILIRLWNGTGVGGDAEGDTLTSIEGVIGSAFSDTLIGSNAQADTLNGGAGNDFLYGINGDDILIGGGGADTLDGGGGFDGADYSDSSAAVQVKLWNGTGVGGDAEGDTLTSIEALRGSAFGDLLVGSNATDDALFGQAGNDFIFALDGDDGINGGAGADVIDGGAGTDTVDYSTSGAGVTIKLWNGTGAGGEAEGDTLTSIEQVIGSDFGDLLIGSNAQTDVLFGAAGNDFIYGLNGNDVLIGGEGADTLDGGAGTDVAGYSASSAAVTVKLWNGTGVGGDAEGDTLTGIESVQGSAFGDLLIGRNTEADFFFGLGGADSIYALSGNDVLDGGGGNDYLDGGTGADMFIFSDMFGNDQVAGFVAAAGEKIDISAISDVTDFSDLTANHLSMSGGNTVITMTHTTNPLMSVATIRAMLAQYSDGLQTGKDSLFAVNAHQTRFYTAEAAPINHDPDNLIRTQDLDPYLEENSLCYLFSKESFKATNARIGKAPLMYATPKLESVDIDEKPDWFMAESLLQRIAVGEKLPTEN